MAGQIKSPHYFQQHSETFWGNTYLNNPNPLLNYKNNINLVKL